MSLKGRPLFTRNTGIVLKSSFWQEANLTATVFTLGAGKVYVNVHGIRKTRKRSRLLYEPGSVGEYELYNRPGDFKSVKEAAFLFYPEKLRDGYQGYYALLYLCALTDKFVPPESPEPQVFGLLYGLLDYFQKNPFYFLPHIFFKLRLLALQGYLPDFSECPNCGRLKPSVVWPAPYDDWLCTACDPNSRPVPEKMIQFLREAAEQKFTDIEEKYRDERSLVHLDRPLNTLIHNVAGDLGQVEEEFYRMVTL